MRTVEPYKLTDADKALIRGMNTARLGDGNIAALHFDGPLLLDMVGAFLVYNRPDPAKGHLKPL